MIMIDMNTDTNYVCSTKKMEHRYKSTAFAAQNTCNNMSWEYAIKTNFNTEHVLNVVVVVAGC